MNEFEVKDLDAWIHGFNFVSVASSQPKDVIVRPVFRHCMINNLVAKMVVKMVAKILIDTDFF
ncbi:MAG: hypothetical protein WCP99_21960 [Burkholderiales bacterium]